MRYQIGDIRCGIPFGDELEFVGMLSKTFPLGGRCPSSQTGADEGLTYRKSPPHQIRRTASNLSSFIVPSEETATFSPHPSRLRRATFPPRGRFWLRHSVKHQFIGYPGETDKHNFQIIPEGDTTTYILYLVSSHIFPPRRAPRGTLPGLFCPGLTRYSGSAPGFFPAPP